MKLQEYIKNKFKTQRQYAKYLQEKYGMAPESYFHFNKKGELVKSSKIGRGKEGLQCHHICEDVVADLSNPEVAKNNDLSYQDPENLCYCNLLEHFLLHILIAEEQREDESGKYLGDGAVRWMVLALNSIFSNPTESWFSKKEFMQI